MNLKKFITITFLILASQSNSLSQSSWFWQNPLPQGSTLNSVKFINAQTGFAVGIAGAVLKSTNSGESWSLYNSLFTNDIYSVAFPNANIVFAVGSDGFIIKTTNAGISWERFSIGTNDTLKSIYFFNSTAGYISGSRGKVFKTTDGGINWVEQTSGTTNNLNCAYFINQDKGFIVGDYKLLRTTNGGNNWTVSDFGSILNSISFINDNTGFLVGGFNTSLRDFLKTTNGGSSWIPINTPSTQMLNEIQFINSSTGFVSGNGNTFFQTTNSGVNWSLNNTITEDGFSLNSVYFPNSNEGYLVGTYGTIFKSTTSGNFWAPKAPVGTLENFHEVLFTNKNTGYTLGNSIVKTTNAGDNWINLNTSFPSYPFGLQFFFETGFVQSFPDLYKTQNGGENWVKINSPQDTISGPEFINKDIGFCVKNPYGIDHYLYKTTNGGLNWNQKTFAPDYVMSYNFPLPNIGYLFLTDLSELSLYKTTNTGESWEYMNHPECDASLPFHVLQFINDNLGFTISFSNSRNYFILDKTTNGGTNWHQVYSDSIGFAKIQLDFVNNSLGFIKGLYGPFMKTTDQGENWFEYNIGNNRIVDFEFIDENIAYAVGAGGLIMKTTNGGVISVEDISSFTPSGFLLKQNYPNPFNPNTIISYELAHNNFVTLKIFDILGKEVITLINNVQNAGSHRIEFSGSDLPSGIYFYKLIVNNDLSETRRMVLLK